MSRAYRVVQMDLGSLAKRHPSKDGDSQSMEDYLEEMLSDGWEFVSSTVDANGYRWVFKAVPKAKGK